MFRDQHPPRRESTIGITYLLYELLKVSCPHVYEFLLDWDCGLLVEVIVRSVAVGNLARLADVVQRGPLPFPDNTVPPDGLRQCLG